MTIAVTISAYRLSTGQIESLTYADDGFTTTPNDTPPNAYFEPRLTDAPRLSRTLFDRTATYGASKSTPGDISLVNQDHALDVLLTDYAVGGRTFEVRSGIIGTPFASWPVIMTGQLDDMKESDGSISIVVHDRMTDLQKTLIRPTYAGDNVLPLGVEGTKDDLKGQYKPRVYGSVLNISAKRVNTSKLVFQVSDTATPATIVYDNGSALTKGADYTTLDDMIATAPAVGNFRCFQGYFRLGSSPVNVVTADVTTSETRAGSLLQMIAVDAGIPLADINTADVAALNAANSAVCGVWADTTTTAQELMDQLASSIGAWYAFDRSNKLRMGRVIAPTGTPMATWGDDAIESLNLQEAGIPAWHVILQYGRNYTVNQQPAGGVAEARKAFLAQEYRQAEKSNTDTKTPWPAAQELTFQTQLVNEADATAECARQLTLYGARRLTLSVEIPLSELGAADLGNVVGLDVDRYNLRGKPLLVIGLDGGADNGVAKLTLWG
ncbi:hypothetical protein ACO0LO_01760 [Undibacterium sp. TJN25]|uniref:hypothetical protein n=1 Tax=Undibacterium sp. TJN25 TaxID=3413056 RepID=UPI003BF03C08